MDITVRGAKFYPNVTILLRIQTIMKQTYPFFDSNHLRFKAKP